MLEKKKDERRQVGGVASLVVCSILYGGIIGVTLIWIISKLFGISDDKLFGDSTESFLCFLPLLVGVFWFIWGFSVIRRADRWISEVSIKIQELEDKLDRM